MVKITSYKVLFCFLFLCSCSINDTFKNTFGSKFFYKSGYEAVRLVNQDVKNIKNIHPINISRERIEGALRLILIKEKTTSYQLFDERDLSNYSTAISDALKVAKPHQDVVITVEGWYKAKYVKNNHVSSARIFYNRKGLNVIFGSIMRKGIQHETDALVAATVNPDLKKNPYVPGSRTQTIKNPYALTAPINSGVFRPKEARNRVDWLVFTPKALRSRGPVSVEDRKLAYRSNIEVQNFRNELNKLKAELRNFRNNKNLNYSNQYNNPEYQYYENKNRYIQPSYNYRYDQRYLENPNIPQNGNQRITNSSIRDSKINEVINLRKRGLISKDEYNQRIKNLSKN